ncbi:hypothetical protein [Pseudonocardia alni]|uniref:hypothetical protein n=1 Tax=Pseudonocardia alni TaxID=33907 RepID=UPI003319051B
MATPVIVGTYSDYSLNSTTVTVPGVQPGDVLIEAFGNSYGTGSPSVGGAGAGPRVEIGTKLGSPNAPNYQNFNLATWRRDATGSGTYTFTVSMAEECMGIVLHLRQADALDGAPSSVVGAQNSSQPAAVGAATITTATSAPLLIAVWGGVQFSGTIAFTAPASMTERAQPRTNQYVALMAATEVVSTTGATGQRTATASPPPAYGWASRMFAVSGAAAPTGPEPGRMLISGV